MRAVPVLRALAPVLLLIGLNNVLGIQMLLPLGPKREFMLSVALPGLLSLASMPLLAAFDAAVRVAIALCVTELLVNLGCAWFLLRRSDALHRIAAP
jgi:hypothetical protein